MHAESMTEEVHELHVDRFAGAPSTWNEFVRAQDGWTHFHLFEWKNVIQEVFGHECIYLTAVDRDDALSGVLPLVRVKSRIFGHYLVSMPFLNYGGPLGTAGAIRKLVDHAVHLARESDADLLELRSRTRLDLDLPVSHRKVDVILELPDNPAALWSQFKTKRRTRIRRAEKEGVEVRFGLSELDTFYTVFRRHMRDLGTPVLSRHIFESIGDHFPDDVRFVTAYLKGVPIASGCGFTWDREFEMTWGASLQEFNKWAPNMLLYWKTMEQAIGEGVRVFNFGRCTPGGGTHKFKLQWGSREIPLFWYQHAATLTEGTPSPDDSRYSWGPRIWKHLPLPLANLMGPAIVRNIP